METHTGNPTVSTHIPWKVPPLPSVSLSRDYEATFPVLFTAAKQRGKNVLALAPSCWNFAQNPHSVPVLTQQTVIQMAKVTFPFLTAIFAKCPEVQG